MLGLFYILDMIGLFWTFNTPELFCLMDILGLFCILDMLELYIGELLALISPLYFVLYSIFADIEI
jgi:hypothetical protein